MIAEAENFDVLLIGTGLSEALLAAALACDGRRVLHLDEAPIYGGAHASLSGAEFFSDLPANLHSRDYTISRSPSIVSALSPAINLLISSKVSRYVDFNLVTTVALYSQSGFRRVPFSKEHVFQDDSLSLIDKRRLMKFLLWAAQSPQDVSQDMASQRLAKYLTDVFSLSQELVEIVLYAAALCSSPNVTVGEALPRIRRHLHSVGKYGSSPFLVAQYGGAGEIAQGYCRACAVQGGVYMLDVGKIEVELPSTLPTENDPQTWNKVTLPAMTARARHIVYGSDYYENSGDSPGVARATIVLLEPLPLSNLGVSPPQDGTVNADNCLLIFPPDTFSHPYTITALQMDTNTMSCPPGQAILYLTSQVDSTDSAQPENILKAAVDKLLCGRQPLVSSYHIQQVPQTNDDSPFTRMLPCANLWDVGGWVDEATENSIKMWKELSDKDQDMFADAVGDMEDEDS